MNLLIIDDDTVDRMNSIRNIKKTGITVNVVEAASAEKGISIARKNTFDIILLDYRLPDMDGLKALKDLRKNTTSNTATVMLSHSNDEALAIACIEAGAQDFILKSEVSSSRLKRAILHAQERFKLEQALRDSNEKLRSLAEKDSLTGLSNRYFFDKSLEEGIAVARRHQTHLALMIFDLDKFKLINDTYGHVSGDTVLKSVATRLNRLIKNEDILCRLGGDEFALLLAI